MWSIALPLLPLLALIGLVAWGLWTEKEMPE